METSDDDGHFVFERVSEMKFEVSNPWREQIIRWAVRQETHSSCTMVRPTNIGPADFSLFYRCTKVNHRGRIEGLLDIHKLCDALPLGLI